MNRLVVCTAAMMLIAVQTGTGCAPGSEKPLDRAAAVRLIESLGGKVKTIGEGSEAWVNVSFIPGDKVDDHALESLKAFPNLHSLFIGMGWNISDAGMVHLRNLGSLRFLVLDHCRITDSGLAEIASLTSLEDLHVGGTQISDGALKYLKRMKSLKHLSIGGTHITDAGLEQLKDLPHLEWLGLGIGGRVTDDGLRHLKELPRLNNLMLSSEFTDAGMVYVGELANLEDLAILNCAGVTDAGVEHLKGLTKLTSLNFRRFPSMKSQFPRGFWN